jgi:hypothetical protein
LSIGNASGVLSTGYKGITTNWQGNATAPNGSPTTLQGGQTTVVQWTVMDCGNGWYSIVVHGVPGDGSTIFSGSTAVQMAAGTLDRVALQSNTTYGGTFTNGEATANW